MELTPQFAALPPLVIGLVHLAKTYGLRSKWAPLLSLLVGVGLAMAVDGFSVESGIAGLVAGLIASGVWSGAKATMQ